MPVDYQDYDSDESEMADLLADNRIAELAEIDNDALAEIFSEIKLDNIDIELTGYTEEEYNAIMAALKDEIEEDEKVDKISEPPAEPKAKHGDIYKLGNHRLMCGDSTNIADVEKLIAGKEIPLYLSDPPYGINIVNNDGKVGAKNFGILSKGEYINVKGDNTTETAEANFNIVSQLTKNQIIFGGNYFMGFLPFSDGWLIWDKRCDSGIRNTFADGEMAWCSFHTPIRIYHQLWNGMIREDEHDKRIHPTQKPVRMLSEIISDFSSENDIILDCFGGSGSTLIACESENRKCYMMEYEPRYIDLIIDRWENYTGEKAVLIERL